MLPDAAGGSLNFSSKVTTEPSLLGFVVGNGGVQVDFGFRVEDDGLQG